MTWPISFRRHKSSTGPKTRLLCATAFSIILFVSKVDKVLEQMQNNPHDWRIEHLKTVARAFNIEWRQRGTSHVVD